MKVMRNEYPRPELVREKWLSLNGEWDFEFDFANSGVCFGDCGYRRIVNYRNEEGSNVTFTRKINVPFCPESDLSGIGYKDFIGACWYKKEIAIPSDWHGRVLLHFEAAFYQTVVFIGKDVVCKHEGGYTPFCCDITDKLVDNSATLFVHCAGDPRDGRQPSGKQSASFASHGCYYTRTTGIWQSVWLECVPENYLEQIFITPDVDNSVVNVKMTFNSVCDKKIDLVATYKGETVGKATCKASGKFAEAHVDLARLELWNVGDGKLYDLSLTVESKSGKDEISTYFGMRKIDVDSKGMLINGKRVMQKLVLDQGYYPEGIYTAKDASDFKKDIDLSLAAGFNGARLHQKVFERRFLYECDKAGYIVWGEYPSWEFNHAERTALLNYLPEWMESVERDYNHPAIITWCPMNENWDYNGNKQCDDFVKQVYYETKRFDKTRPVVDSSWCYHVKTDFYDVHEYVQDVETFKKFFGEWKEGEIYDGFKQEYHGEPYILSEYGGFKWSASENGWGYGEAPKSEKEYEERFVAFAKIILNNPRICGLCYTQLYDVEQEQNGIYNFDRSNKFDDGRIARLKAALDCESEYEKLK